MLLTLKERTRAFKLLARELDGLAKELSSSVLDRLAREFVGVLFADFASAEKSVVAVLKQLEEPIKEVLTNYCEGKQYLAFGDEDLMVNRMIKAFINSSDNRVYLNLLFGKLFFEATDLRPYLQKLEQKKTAMMSAGEEALDLKKVTVKTKANRSLINSATTNESFSYRLPANSSSSSPDERAESPDFEVVFKPGGCTELSAQDILLLSEGMLGRIVKNLVHMPLSMRHFCKLLERIVVQIVDL